MGGTKFKTQLNNLVASDICFVPENADSKSNILALRVMFKQSGTADLWIVYEPGCSALNTILHDYAEELKQGASSLLLESDACLLNGEQRNMYNLKYKYVDECNPSYAHAPSSIDACDNGASYQQRLTVLSFFKQYLDNAQLLQDYMPSNMPEIWQQVAKYCERLATQVNIPDEPADMDAYPQDDENAAVHNAADLNRPRSANRM